MRGGFRARKKTLKQAGWQVVDESKAGDREYELVLQKSDGDQKIFKADAAYYWLGHSHPGFFQDKANPIG